MIDAAQLEWVQIGERIALGTFFAISGGHKLFSPVVHARIVSLFARVGVKNPLVEWLVPGGEFLGGVALVLGFLTGWAAGGLILILLGAIYLDVWQADVVGKHPMDFPDWIAKTLYCPEVLMIWVLVSIILLGSGPYSVDAVLSRAGWVL